MRKTGLVALVALLAFTVLLAGCGGSTQPTAQAPAAGQGSAPQGQSNSQPAAPTKASILDKIKKEGKLTIGTSADYPPFESLDKDNKIVGFDIDLANEVAKKLGVRLEITNIAFEGLIPALQAGKFDIMFAGVTITEERKQKVDFSVPYLSGGNAIVVHADNKDPIQKLDDLKGKKVAVQLGSAQETMVSKVQGIDVKRYPLFTDAALAVSTRQADAMVLHSTVAKAFAKQDPKLKVVAELEPVDTAVVFRKDTPELRDFVNGVIEEMKKDGRMDQLLAKWFK